MLEYCLSCFAIIISIIIAPVSTQNSCICPSVFNTHHKIASDGITQQGCYCVVKSGNVNYQNLSFPLARILCQAIGKGFDVAPLSHTTEQEFLLSISVAFPFWIGLQDLGNAARSFWVWTDEREMSTDPFIRSWWIPPTAIPTSTSSSTPGPQPDGGVEANCVIMDSQGYWYDTDCEEQRPVLCKNTSIAYTFIDPTTPPPTSPPTTTTLPISITTIIIEIVTVTVSFSVTVTQPIHIITQDPTWLIVGLILLFLALLFLLIFLIWWCCCRKKPKPKRIPPTNRVEPTTQNLSKDILAITDGQDRARNAWAFPHETMIMSKAALTDIQ